MAGHQIKQQISAGGNFDGTAPLNPPTVDDGTQKTFDPEPAGGEFSPSTGTLKAITLQGGNQSSVEFKIIYGDGAEKQLCVCGFPDRQVHWSGSEALAATDKISVITQHARRAMVCDLAYTD